MNVLRRGGGGTISFREFAEDHTEHYHCVSCAGCIIDPDPALRQTAPVWCIGCRDRVAANLPVGCDKPWLWEK